MPLALGLRGRPAGFPWKRGPGLIDRPGDAGPMLVLGPAGDCDRMPWGVIDRCCGPGAGPRC